MPLPLVAETAERQTLDEIRAWHAGVVESLVIQRASIQHALRDGTAVSFRFVGMTEADLDRYYDGQRRELDRLTILNLVASAEASLIDDFFRRIRDKLKDPLSHAYRT